MTSFYSWRQFLMTFHGRYRGADEARASRHADATHAHDEPMRRSRPRHHASTLSEVHEAPLTMLVPLAVLAVGALFAGAIFDHCFIGDESRRLLARRARRDRRPRPERMPEEFPIWVEFAPFVLTILGFAIAYYYYILHPELPAQMAAKRGLLYMFLYNKWYFDELYDFLFVRPALWLGRFLWKVGDGLIIDGLGPDGIAARVLDATRGAVRLQSGYVYHYAFAMLIGVVALATWFMCAGGVPVSHLPILTIITFLPLVGALVILLLARRASETVARNARWIALDHHARRSRAVACDLGRISTARLPRSSSWSTRTGWAAASATTWAWTAFPMLFVVLTAGLMPFCILASWESIETRVARIHDRVPRARNADDRRVLRARSVPVLRLLRGRPDPDVPDHRRVGRQAARLCELQVLPLHAARLGADAARDPGDVSATRAPPTSRCC